MTVSICLENIYSHDLTSTFQRILTYRLRDVFPQWMAADIQSGNHSQYVDLCNDDENADLQLPCNAKCSCK